LTDGYEVDRESFLLAALSTLESIWQVDVNVSCSLIAQGRAVMQNNVGIDINAVIFYTNDDIVPSHIHMQRLFMPTHALEI
jgi:hypothetical protein